MNNEHAKFFSSKFQPLVGEFSEADTVLKESGYGA